MKHKYEEVIKAFLDGKQCEGWNYQTKNWYEITRLGSFDYCDDARIKPEPKPDVIRYGYISSPNMKSINLTFCVYEIDNIKFTFDGETGKLKSAEVIK